MAGLIERHARHLSAMLGEVREVAVRESLGADRRVDLADVYVPDLVRSAGAAAGLDGDRLISDIDRGLILLRTDGEKTLRILTNLLENANKHSPPDAAVEVQPGPAGRVDRAVGPRPGAGHAARVRPPGVREVGLLRPPPLDRPRDVDRRPAGRVTPGHGLGRAPPRRRPGRPGPLPAGPDDVGADDSGAQIRAGGRSRRSNPPLSRRSSPASRSRRLQSRSRPPRASTAARPRHHLARPLATRSFAAKGAIPAEMHIFFNRDEWPPGHGAAPEALRCPAEESASMASRSAPARVGCSDSKRISAFSSASSRPECSSGRRRPRAGSRLRRGGGSAPPAPPGASSGRWRPRVRRADDAGGVPRRQRYRTSGLYLMRWGWAASAPRRFFRSAS